MRIPYASPGTLFFLLLMFLLPTLVLAQDDGGAAGEGGKGVKATVTVTEEEKKEDEAFRKGLDEGFKRMMEEEYWKGELERYRKKVQKKREEALRRAQEIARINRLWDYEMFEDIWWYDMYPPRPARPPIGMDYPEAFDNFREEFDNLPKEPEGYDFVGPPEAKTWTQDEVDQYWQDREEKLEKMPDAIGPVTGPFVVTALVGNGLVDMECTGTGKTDTIVVNLTNKTDEPILAIIPAGTPLITGSEGYQPYQTGAIPPLFLEPGKTLTRECPAWCTNNDLEPAPAEASVTYTFQAGPATSQQEKIRELILLTDYMEDLHTVCGSVVEPDDFVQLPLQPDTESAGQKEHEPFPQFTSLSFDLSSPLEFPGTMQFSLSAEDGILKSNISSKDDKKGEIVFSNPQGKVEVSVKPTDNPAVLKFDITELSAKADSFEVIGKSNGDINMVLGSPEKSTGFLNINTGEVNGTVSVKASGKKYKDPFPAAGTFTGRFDFPTRKLSLSFNGLSFEPVELKQEIYQLVQPEKYWDAVHLYTIWGETNDVGRKELKAVMTEQLKAEFPGERSEELSQMVTTEIMNRVKEVQKLHKKLKKEEFDFSKLDPTLKLRKT